MKNNWKYWIKRQAALAAVLALGISSFTAFTAIPGYAQEQEKEEERFFPDEIVLETPRALREVELPQSKYGTLSWEEEDFVPDQAEQSCTVLLKVKDEVDLSDQEGYDAEKRTLTGKVTVIVESLRADEATEEEEAPEEPAEEEVLPSSEEEIAAPEKGGISEESEAVLPESISEEPEESQETPVEVRTEDVPRQDEETPDISSEEAPHEEVTDIFSMEEIQDDREILVSRELSAQEQLQAALRNHTCNGITVSGAELPWYVQFRVHSGDGFCFTNEANAEIFRSFDFELWDLIHDKEYEIPDGAYISVSIPVKEGYHYTVEHILKTGATETIIPSVTGGLLEFSAHSFSPFGIAGSMEIVTPFGGDETVTPTPTPKAVRTATPTPGQGQAISNASSATVTPTPAGQKVENPKAVQTGDNTRIIPLIILAGAALVIVILVVVLIIVRRK